MWNRKISSHIVVGGNLKHINDQAFIHDLHFSPIADTLTIQDPELALSYFTNLSNLVLHKHVPFKKTRTKVSSTSWFSTELSTVFYFGNNTWTLARCTKDPCHWLSVRQLRNKCTKTNYYLHSFNTYPYSRISSGNHTTPLSAYVANGHGYKICTAFNNQFSASDHLFDSLNVDPHSCLEEL